MNSFSENRDERNIAYSHVAIRGINYRYRLREELINILSNKAGLYFIRGSNHVIRLNCNRRNDVKAATKIFNVFLEPLVRNISNCACVLNITCYVKGHGRCHSDSYIAIKMSGDGIGRVIKDSIATRTIK